MEIKIKVFGKRGAFFSADALLALMIILFVLLVARPAFDSYGVESYVHSDSLQVLSTLKTNELDSATVASITGYVRNLDQNVLVTVGELYATGEEDLAMSVISSVFDGLEIEDNLGVWIGTDPSNMKRIYSRNDTPIEGANEVKVARKLITGVFGENTTGYSARAYLASSARSDYYYLGGYVGDGNISLLVNYNGSINFVEMELAINNDFELFVNNVSQGTYSASPSQFEPARYSINTTDFNDGDNILEFKGNNLFIAGGFVKVNYNADVVFGGIKKHYFPGMNGIINLYDGLYIPGNLTAMEISLHLDNNVSPIFLNFGNVTLYNDVTNGEETVILNDAYLKSKFGGSYTSLERKNIPLRFGFENITLFGITQDIDVISVSDLSGSMLCSNPVYYYSQSACESRGYIWQGPINDAKAANVLLSDIILNNSGNWLGLAGFESVVRDPDFHPLSREDSSLDAEANQWDAGGGTCICCGINYAVRGFLNNFTRLYYPLDGNLFDSSDDNRDGAMVGGSASYISGLNGSAVVFDGVNDYINAGDFRIGSRGSIAFWFKLNNTFNSASATTQGLWSKYSSNSNNAAIALRGSDYIGGEGSTGNIIVKMERSSGAIYLRSTTSTWSANTWHHFALTWDGDDTRLYVNGAQQNTDTASGNLNFGAGNRFGGAQFDTTNLASLKYLNGSMDDIRMYDRALNPWEIQDIATQNPECGNNIVETGEICDGNSVACNSGGNPGTRRCGSDCSAYSVCDTADNRYRSMIVMSDGQANYECSEQNTGDASDDAVLAAQQACTLYGVVTHAIGFGGSADSVTLTAVAKNTCGGSYTSSSTTNLTQVYTQVAYNIITAYAEQTINASGDFNTKLFPDSYIDLTYTQDENPYGLIVTAEKMFSDSSSGSFQIDSGSEILDAKVISYSGPRWTQSVFINGNEIYNLSKYGLDYIFVGDPYQVVLPLSYVVQGVNYVNLTTGNSKSNSSVGSADNKIIYTVLRNITTFSSILPKAEGCNWTIQLSNYENITAVIPSEYNGSNQCRYNMQFHNYVDSVQDSNDGYQDAVFKLFEDLDFDEDGRVDVYFSEQDLEVLLSDLSGIPYPWETEVQVRRWI